METHKEKTNDITDNNGGIRFMDKIQRCVDSLMDAIRESETYQKYMDCEDKLKELPDLKERIDEYRIAVFHLNNEDCNEDLYEKTTQFQERYRELRKNPLVNEYLEVELDVCKMLQYIGTRVQGGVEIKVLQI